MRTRIIGLTLAFWLPLPLAAVPVVPAGFTSQLLTPGTFFTGLAPGSGAFGTDLYATFGNSVFSIDTTTGVATLFSTNTVPFNSGLAFDTGVLGTGDLYVSQNNGAVTRIAMMVDPLGNVSVFSSGLGLNIDIAFGSAGTTFGDNLYASDPNSQTIYQIDSTGLVSPFATGLSFSNTGFDADIAFSSDGLTMYVTDSTGIFEIVGAPVATVPEPTTFTLLGIGLIGVAASRRRKSA